MVNYLVQTVSREASGPDAELIEAMALAAGFTDLAPETGIAVQNRFGEIVAACAQAELILGLSPDQMRGRTSHDPRWAAVDELGQPMSGEQHPAMRALRTHSPVRNATMGVHRPGTEAPGKHVWLDVDAVPLTRDGEEEPYAVIVAFRPITGERLEHLELRDSERMYRMIAERTSDMVAWQLVADSTFLWVSPASRTVLGYAPHELVGRSSVDLVHDEDRVALERWRATIIAGARVPRLTLRMRHADGTFRWVERTVHALPVEDDAPAQMITVQRDVSDRVRAEQARDAAVHVFEVAMAHATVGMAVRSVDGRLIRVNPALCAILGRTPEELIGRHLREFTAGPDRAADRGLHAVESGETDHHEAERQFRRPDGSTVWCIRSVIGLPVEDGGARLLLVQLQDITARKDAAALLEKAALTDALTGLPNRVVLEDRLNRALASACRSGTRVGVLFIDLDHFKEINDTLGHDVGDAVLREVGIRLADSVRHSDTVARLGGDEFVVIHENLCEVTELDMVAHRVREALARPFAIDGCLLRIAASVGTSFGDSTSARELLRHADDAMYRMKRSRLNHRVSPMRPSLHALPGTHQ